jgi:hypothetical protein
VRRSVPVYVISNTHVDRLRELVEQADDAIARHHPTTLRAQRLMETMVELRDALKAIYIDVAGQNPWSTIGS